MSGLEFRTTLSDFKKSVSYIDFVINNTYALFALRCTSFPFQDKFNMHDIQKQRMSLLLPYYLCKRLDNNGHRSSVSLFKNAVQRVKEAEFRKMPVLQKFPSRGFMLGDDNFGPCQHPLAVIFAKLLKTAEFRMSVLQKCGPWLGPKAPSCVTCGTPRGYIIVAGNAGQVLRHITGLIQICGPHFLE